MFDNAQSEYLQREEAVLSGYPFVFVCHFNTDDLVNFQSLMNFVDKDTGKDYFHLFLHSTNDKVVALARSTAQGEHLAYTSSSYSANTWHHACAIFVSATDRRVFIDGGSKGTNATNVTPPNMDRTSIGRLGRATPGNYMSGMIAEAAIYDLSAYPGATAPDKADYFEANVLPGLAAGEPASSYPTGLTASWSFETSSLEDEADDFDLTASGTTFSYNHPSVYRNLGGLIPAESALTGNIDTIENLIGLIEAQSAVSGKLQWLQELAGSIGAQSGISGNLQWLQELAGSIGAQSSLTGNIISLESLVGLIEAQSTTAAKLRDLSSLSGSLASQSSLTGVLKAVKSLTGNIIALSSVSGDIYSGLTVMPPEMHNALINPYSGGAWLWLVEINIPGYAPIYLARNPEDITYGGVLFTKNNFDVGLASLTGDGSVPRIILRVAQDADYTLEDKINATEGAGDGNVKIIRVHEDFLDNFIAELEQIVKILTTESDTTHVTFILGIPNPFLRKVPLRRYSSKTCPYALPGLFKGIECQYAGGDPTCTGFYTDCYTKGNEIHFGAELGLDPNTARI